MKINFGCGSRILKDWVNLDVYARPLWCADNYIRLDPNSALPFQDESVDFIYSEHFIEKLKFEDCLDVFLELHRILKPTGALRISTPDLDKISNKLRIAEVESTLQLYEMSKLKENLWLSGFIDVKICVCGESNYPELCNLEHKSEDGDLIVEARKFLVDL